MTALPWQVLRAVTIAGLVAVVVLGVLAFTRDGAGRGGDDRARLARPRAGEVTVDRALLAAGDRPLAVRGFVHEGGGFPLRLCAGLVGDDPPACVGPFLEVGGIDAARFNLERGRDARGATVAWSPEPVALLGTVTGPRLAVTQVLS